MLRTVVSSLRVGVRQPMLRAMYSVESSGSASGSTGASTSTSTPTSLSDAEVDAYLDSIQELRQQFKTQGFTPESSLAPPGKGKLDLAAELERAHTIPFTPTEAQRAEYDALRGVPLPQRTDPVIQQCTNMIMRDGKKQRAERHISRALYLAFLQTRTDPVQLLKKCLDDLAPLMVVKTFSTGVAKANVVPVPLSSRQRTRIAWKWIVDASKSRASSDFAVRLGEEIVAVSKGTGSAFDKRDQIHKAAIAHRAYIKLK